MKWLPARPTTYSGIRMRSRLEADFARWLDRLADARIFDAVWDYEPQCFADKSGQYLPDFRISHPDHREYIELKPDGLSEDLDVDTVLKQMEIIWSSEPSATLTLMFWRFEHNSPTLTIAAAGDARVWWSQGEGEPDCHLWPGMGQLEALVREVQAERTQV